MIRVLRLLEYTYASVEMMERDMARWGVQGTYEVRLQRSTQSEPDMRIKSVTLPLEVLNESPLTVPAGTFSDEPKKGG